MKNSLGRRFLALGLGCATLVAAGAAVAVGQRR